MAITAYHIALIRQIESELRFLNSTAMKELVHEADLGACHQDSRVVENRKRKLKRLLAEVQGR